ncbi:MAG: AsmA-like C-terminal region-containing protein [Endomicrobiaceae bacterium]
MKKIKKLLLFLTVSAFIFALAAFIAFKIFLTQDKIKSYIIDYARNEFRREVKFDKLSFKFIGFELENFSMSEKSSFDNGTFVKARSLAVKMNIIPLLRKKITVDTISVDGMYIEIKRNAAGIFNFDDIAGSGKAEEQHPEDDKSGSLFLNIDRLYVKDSTVKFDDKTNGLNTEVSDVNIQLSGFSFNGLFLCDSSFKITYKQRNTDINFPVKIKFETDLNNFDQNKLFLNILSLQTKYNNADLLISGKAENLNVPKIDLNISVKNIDETTFGDFFKTAVKYNIKSLDLKSRAVIDISSKTAVINDLSLDLPQSSASISGSIDWNGPDMLYNIQAKTDFLLDNLADVVPQYALKGRIKSQISATQTSIEGNIDFENVFSANPSYGNIENLNAKTQINAETKQPLPQAFKTFNINKFVVKIISLNGKYNNTDVCLSGNWKKAATSKINLDLQTKNFSDAALSSFYKPKTDFALAYFNLSADSVFDFKNKTADFSKLDIKFPESSLSSSGRIDWSKDKLSYKINLAADLLLDNVSNHIGTYNVKGRIKSSAKLSDVDFSGDLNCSDISFEYPPFINVSGLSLQASALSKKDITLGQIKGVFNTGNFTASASYKDNNLNMKLRMDKLALNDSSDKQSSSDSENENNEQKKKMKQTGSDAKTNINADIIINEISIPYLTGGKVVLNTAVNSVSAGMNAADGVLNLSLAGGKITNVQRLSKNKFAKIFLMIFNVLNNNIAVSDKVNNKEKGIIYEDMKCNLIFTDGLMKTKQVFIKMPLTTISTSGTINFKSGSVDMKVNTGLYAAMKVSGTVENPRTSFDLIGTAADIISGSKGTIENVGKKLGESLQNIFK